MPYLLEAECIVKRYKDHPALDDVSIQVQPNSVFGPLGPDGAGKSTLIKIINEILLADSGTVLLNGKEMTYEDIRHIGYLPEEHGLYKKMEVSDQAIYPACLHRLSRWEAQQELKHWFEKSDIMPWQCRKAEELSKGMQQKVQFICIAIHRLKLLIFDEPFSGFDPVSAELLKHEILELRDNGRAAIFFTHSMQPVEGICDDIALINQSKVVLRGNVAEVKRSYFEGIAPLLIAGEGYRPNWVEFPIEQQIELLEIKREGHDMCVRLKDPQQRDVRAPAELVPTDLHLLEVAQEIPSMQDILIRTTTAQAQPATITL